MLIAILLTLFTGAAASAPSSEDQVREAITAAVKERMGATAAVTVTDLVIDGTIDGPVVAATPEPGSKLERVMRFMLRTADGSRARTATATAKVAVSVTHAHASHYIERGAELSPADLVETTHEISTGILRALPNVDAASHSRALRALEPDTCVTSSAVAALPAVRSGREVVAIARIADVEATATLTAVQSGEAGSVVQVVNRQTQRLLKARVIAAGVVEIIHD
jgi:flagella basal body P-ring formation protein FlgA